MQDNSCNTAKVNCKAGQFEIKKMKVSKIGVESKTIPGESIKNHVQIIKIPVITRPQKTVKLRIYMVLEGS